MWNYVACWHLVLEEKTEKLPVSPNQTTIITMLTKLPIQSERVNHKVHWHFYCQGVEYMCVWFCMCVCVCVSSFQSFSTQFHSVIKAIPTFAQPWKKGHRCLS